jgi:hypothetical protein
MLDSQERKEACTAHLPVQIGLNRKGMVGTGAGSQSPLVYATAVPLGCRVGSKERMTIWEPLMLTFANADISDESICTVLRLGHLK